MNPYFAIMMAHQRARGIQPGYQVPIGAPAGSIAGCVSNPAYYQAPPHGIGGIAQVPQLTSAEMHSANAWAMEIGGAITHGLQNTGGLANNAVRAALPNIVARLTAEAMLGLPVYPMGPGGFPVPGTHPVDTAKRNHIAEYVLAHWYEDGNGGSGWNS